MSLTLDPSGVAVGNYVSNEAHLTSDIYSSTFSTIFSGNGPIYSEGLLVNYTPNGGITDPLVLGLDYELIYLLPGISASSTNKVYGGIKILNANLAGEITISYHALGGSWVFDLSQIYQFQQNNYLNATNNFAALILSPATYSPSSPLSLADYMAIATSLAATSPIHLGITNVSNGVVIPGNSGTSSMAIQLAAGSANVGSVTANIGNTNGLALDASIQTLIASIQSSISLNSTVWVDNTVNPAIYYIRHELDATGTITINWSHISGASATPNIANLTAADSSGKIAQTTVVYTATGSGTGYVSGDVLIHCYGIDTATTPASLAYSLWFNAGPSVPNGTVLTVAPTGGTYAQITSGGSTLPTNAAQESGGNLATIATATSTVAAVAGAGTDTDYSGTGTGTFISLLKGIYNKLAGILNIRALDSTTDSITTVPSGTQNVSMSLLPSLATGTNTIGSIANTAFEATQSSAAALNATVVGTGTLAVQNTAAIPTGSNAIGTVGVTALPAIPTGTNSIGQVTANAGTNLNTSALALESGGNLASVASSNTTIATNTGATTTAINTAAGNAASGITIPTGGLGQLGWLSGIFNKLNTSVAVTGTFYQATQPVSLATIPVLPAGSNVIGGVTQSGTWNIGSISTLPALATGSNAIGSITNTSFAVTQSNAANLLATVIGTGTFSVQNTAAIPAGSNAIGSVSVSSLPAIPTGSNTIGTVNLAPGSSVAISSGSISVGAVTANAGTNLNTSALALESGGNLASVATATGTQADAVYSGSGSGSVLSVLKGIFGNTGSAGGGYGTVGAAVGTTATNTGWNNGGILTTTSLTSPLPQAISGTNFIFSTSNSTVAQLAANATFPGVIESTLNQQTISILLTVDQPGILTLNQYIDLAGTRTISSWSFNIVAGVPFSRAFTANGNYFGLTYKNTGSATTTTLNLNAAYGTLFPANNLGNLPTSIADVNGTVLSAATLPVTLTDASANALVTSLGSLMVQDNSAPFLRRIIKLLESQAAADIAQRARVAVDSISAGVILPTVTTVTGVTTVSTVTTLGTISSALPTGTNTIGNVTIATRGEEMHIDSARMNYAMAIRSRLTFA